jgi:hypothetical protein
MPGVSREPVGVACVVVVVVAALFGGPAIVVRRGSAVGAP